MEITWSAVRCVRRSSARSPRYGSVGPPGNRDWKSSGHRSWWSNTNLVRSISRKARAIGQKMSGGLHAWITANRPLSPRPQRVPRGRQERVHVLG